RPPVPLRPPRLEARHDLLEVVGKAEDRVPLDLRGLFASSGVVAVGASRLLALRLVLVEAGLDERVEPGVGGDARLLLAEEVLGRAHWRTSTSARWSVPGRASRRARRPPRCRRQLASLD